ncbi:MAG: phospho-N-acetylmuramoyl-pentapeptide-transferase [Oscillospiraceae bacterium]
MVVLMSMVLLLSFGLTALSGLWLIPYLRKLKYGQTILDIGPSWHKNKQGTPTMGGIMFIFGITLSTLSGLFLYITRYGGVGGGESVLNARIIAGLVSALGFALIGFGDDYVKVTKKQNMGFSAKQKLILQVAVAALYMWWIYTAGDVGTNIFIPFFGSFDLGLFYFPLCILGIVYIVNSVNLTDGLDGLAVSVTAVVAIIFFGISIALGVTQNLVLCVAVEGGCLAFLIYNAYPAKVFMGDTGSMFLGGLVIAMAFGVRLPIFLGLAGIIYIVESMSVILQVISFKTTGKRIFKMSPIHHHFEMCGFTERQIVAMFVTITAIGGILSILAVKML